MFGEWRRRRVLRRVEPGDGRSLKRFRWWQVPFRALLRLRLAEADGEVVEYAVDVRHWQNQSSGEVKADLYRDGVHRAVCRLPAVFPVPGGHVEVAMSGFGLKRCHYVTADGAERQLTPDPASAEGRRARFDRNHPALSRAVGVGSVLVLGVALVLAVLQTAGTLTEAEPVARHVGTFTSPVRLSWWGNAGLAVGSVMAATERALRLRHSRVLGGAAG
ncbi:hypothetical protein ACFWMQ_23310 [Streptomyces sp. NPDC058372]|uniref:hypothetical protein n=1 Tax=Streptomyces sp. NPDC058372 TaxID=3346464 RepID=UPI0036509FD1